MEFKCCFQCFISYVLHSAAAIYIWWKKYRQHCKQCRKIQKISPKVVFLVSSIDDWRPAYATIMEDLSSLKVLLLTLTQHNMEMTSMETGVKTFVSKLCFC